MKPRNRNLLPITIAVTIAGSLSTASAANRTWDGSDSSDWGNTANWSGAAIPGSGDNVTFSGTPTNADTTIGATDYTIQGIFADNTLTKDISIGGTGTLTFNPYGINPASH